VVNRTNVPLSFCDSGAQSINTRFSDTRIGAVFGAGIEFKPASHWTFAGAALTLGLAKARTQSAAFPLLGWLTPGSS
jgi:hypothetical protein